MKNLLFLLASIFSVTIGFSQELPLVSSENQVNLDNSDDLSAKVRPTVSSDRAAGDTIWSSDFSVPGDWTAAGPSSDYAINGWSIGTSTSGWYFGTAGNMGTTGNFARFVNGDPNIVGTGGVVQNGPFTLAYTAPINLTGVPAPSIQFAQYGARFVTLQAVEVSTDGGTTWIEVGNNLDIPPLTSGGGSVYGQPEIRQYTIGNAIAGNPANVTIRFLWDGAQNGANVNYIEYAWFVDNVQIIEGSNYDAKIEAGRFTTDSLEYYMVPESQISGIQLTGEVFNNGDSTHTGLQLVGTVDMAGNVFNGTSVANDLPPYTLDTMAASTLFTPSSGLGMYDVTYTFVGTNPDDLPGGNDTIIDSFEVTNSTYARDNGIQNGGITNFAGNSGLDFKIGNQMKTFGNGYMNEVSIMITSAPANAGQFITGTVYRLTNGTYTEIETTDLYQVATTDLDTFVTLQLNSPIQVQANEIYLICAGHFGGAGVIFGTAQPTYMGSVLGFTSGATSPAALTNPSAIMIRASITESVTVNQSVTICSGDTYSVGNSTYNSPGLYVDSLISIVSGNDSIVNTSLGLAQTYNDTISVSICAGDSYVFGGTSYNTSGFYTNTLQTVNFGCDSTVIVDLQVEQPINATITENQFLLSADPAGAAYEWLDCDAGFQVITGEVSQDFFPSFNGSYSVVVTVNGCSDTSVCELIQGLGLNKFEKLFFSVYPNPANNSISIKLTSSGAEVYSLKILNNLGQTVRVGEIVNAIEYQINDLSLPNGIYFIELTSDGKQHMQKIVIQN